MKKEIHPAYRPVAFQDLASGDVLVVSSTVATKETITIDGATYPLVRIEVSSTSHPFYTGKRSIVDSTGRVDRFKKLSTRAAETQNARAKTTSGSRAKKSPQKKGLEDLTASSAA